MKQLLLLCCLFLSCSELQVQKVPYQVVFDLTSSDTTIHQSVIRWLGAIVKEHPDAQLEVVLYGQSLNMVQKNKSVVAAPLQELLKNKNIQFSVCQAAMKRHQIDESSLLPGVGTVPDGIYQIVTRQKQGWGYIKAIN